MAETTCYLRLLRFGDFEVDLRSGELRKAGVKVKVGGQPFQVLAILLEQPGTIVTREELQKRLWPDTFVDVDHNLNTAINKIREVLGDSADSPRFVETLPRRGYRFIGELESPVKTVVTVEPDRGLQSRQTWLKIGAGVLTILVVGGVGAVVAYRRHRQQSPQKQAALNLLPFTALPGEETSPVFSPDGSRIAFAWNGDPAHGAKGFDLYVKALGSETLLRLTRHPSEWISPAWSPDGTQIAFHRLDGHDTGIYVVPALGGPERKLRSTRIPSWDLSPISWSPDGRQIAFSDLLPEEERAMIYLLSAETLETERIPNGSKCLAQSQPAFSHRGDHLAYLCFISKDEFSLHSLPLPAGQPAVLSHVQGYYPNGLTWSADDKELLYSIGVMNFNEFGAVAVANGSVKRLAFGGNARWPSVSSIGDKLALSSSSSSQNIWRRDLVHPEAPAVELISSTRAQYNAQYSPDGKCIAFASERAGVPGVWISMKTAATWYKSQTPMM
jgi:DNA-binding winged helix-turn-helix (wHTH) protein/Tol biopolymer transport system component